MSDIFHFPLLGIMDAWTPNLGEGMMIIGWRRLDTSKEGTTDSSGYSVVVVQARNDLRKDKLVVAMEEGGRVRIPHEMYERIGSGPGGSVQMRRCGSTVVIERVPDRAVR
ncbi:MAG: hypothetical protein AB1445_05985 [Bacillota bacterium]